MLELLRIRNLALIDDLELEFAPGLNALTGETGAGKSFILRAVNFLTGDKLTPDMVRAGRDKAMVEALFVVEGVECVIRRELASDTGRSRLYVNDRLSSLETVESLKSGLVLHTSQHGQQKLLSPAYQSRMLDAFLPDKSLLGERDQLRDRLRTVAGQRKDLLDRVSSLSAQREFLDFQSREIAKVNPKPGEEDELTAKRQALKDRTGARQSLDGALSLLHGQGGDGLLAQFDRLGRQVRGLVAAVPDLREEAQVLDDFRLRLGELDGRLRRCDLRAAAGDLEAVDARLFELAQLKRKLKRDLDGIVHLQQELRENLSFLDESGLDLKRLDKEEQELADALQAVLARLHADRRQAATGLKADLETELRQLGFSEHVHVEIDFEPHEIFPGISEERARVLWVPNPGQAPQPLDKIASGGELSRFLLALVGLLTQAEQPTLIFDEVDAGIGGLTLGTVAERLKALSRRQQIILITHWPQLAAKADRHFQVRKEVEAGQTYTRCGQLSEADIFEELSRMAGGGDQGQALARELLS
ncbi:MAG: AAA family ATPase [Desulfocurvibacter africanus]